MKRFMSLFLCMALMFTVSGCRQKSIFADYREVENMELVRVIGIDKTDRGVMATVSSGVTGSNPTPRVITKTAITMTKALADVSEVSPKEDMFYAHSEQLVLGEAAAVNGIAPYLDYVERENNTRMAMGIYVVKGGTAKDLISKTWGEEADASTILESIKKEAEGASESKAFTCGELAAALAESGCGIAMAVELKDKEEDSETGAGEKVIDSAGYAIFKDGKLVDYVNIAHSGGVNTLINEIDNKIVEIKLDGEEKLALRMISGKTEYEPQFDSEGNISKVIISVKLRLNIEEMDAYVDIHNEEVQRDICQRVQEQEGEDIKAVLTLAKKLDCDFLSIGKFVETKAPVKFSKMPEEWGSIFKDIEYEYRVKAELERTYDIEDMISVTGSD